MNGAEVGLVFGAGMAAAFNPCGVAMLPSYISYLVGQDRMPSGTPWRSGWRGATVGLWMTLGFLTVFVILGLTIASIGRVLYVVLPWLSVAIGVLLIVVGVLLWMGKGMEINTSRYLSGLSKRIAVGQGRSMYLYGVIYAVASLGCTLPVFLMLVAQSIVLGKVGQGVINFILYALGMGVVVILISILSLLANAWLSLRLRQVMPFVSKVSSAIIVLAGFYIVGYWLIGHHLL